MGGPQSDDSFEDSRGWCCAAYNEVAIDYNAGFTGAIARLVDYYKDQRLFSDCGLDLGWEHPNATIVSFLDRCHCECTQTTLDLFKALFQSCLDAVRMPSVVQADRPKYPDNDCYHTCCRPRRSRKAEGNFHGRPRQIHHRNRKTESINHARRLFGIGG